MKKEKIFPPFCAKVSSEDMIKILIEKISQIPKPFCKQIAKTLIEINDENTISEDSLIKFSEFYRNSSFAICPEIVIMESGKIGISFVVDGKVILTSVF